MRKLFHLLTAFTVLFMVSCSDDTETELKEIKINLEEPNIKIEEYSTGTIKIIDGNGDYKLTDDHNPTIIEAKLKDNTISIRGIREGKTKLIIVDAKNRKLAVRVHITRKPDKLRIGHVKLAMKVGEYRVIEVVGGLGLYEATSDDNSILTAEINTDRKLTLTRHKKGKVNVRVKDLKNGDISEPLTITTRIDPIELVYPEDIDEPNKAIIYLNDDMIIKTKEGSGDFKVESSDTSTLKVTKEGENIIVKGLKEGQVKIIVTDNGIIEHNKTAEKKVNETSELTVYVRDLGIITENDFINFKGEKEVRIYNNQNIDNNNVKHRMRFIKLNFGDTDYNVEVTQGKDLIETALIGTDVLKIKSKEGADGEKNGIAFVKITDKNNPNNVMTIKVRVVIPLRISKGVNVDLLVGQETIKPFLSYDKNCNNCMEHINVTTNNNNVSVKLGSNNSYKGLIIKGETEGHTNITLSDNVLSNIKLQVVISKPKLIVSLDDDKIVDEDKPREQSKDIEIEQNSSISLKIKGNNDYKITYTPENLVTEEFTKATDLGENSILTLKSSEKSGIIAVKIVDNITNKHVYFNIKIKGEKVEQCDKQGKLKFSITDYGGATHDNTPTVENNHTCEETITMKVGDILTINFCGGYLGKTYTVFSAKGDKWKEVKEMVNIAQPHTKGEAISTIKAIKPGSFVLNISGYKLSKERETKFYKIVIK